MVLTTELRARCSARDEPWQRPVLDAASVGTFGRHLVCLECLRQDQTHVRRCKYARLLDLCTTSARRGVSQFERSLFARRSKICEKAQRSKIFEKAFSGRLGRQQDDARDPGGSFLG